MCFEQKVSPDSFVKLLLVRIGRAEGGLMAVTVQLGFPLLSPIGVYFSHGISTRHLGRSVFHNIIIAITLLPYTYM